MTICSLLSSEQTTAIKDQFAGVEITDADFDRIEVIGDLIRHIEIVDTGNAPESWSHGARARCIDLRREIAERGSNLMSPTQSTIPSTGSTAQRELALSRSIGNPEAKRTMLKNADDYERLAQRAEERAAGRLPQSK
jgi:hypothetical protein